MNTGQISLDVQKQLTLLNTNCEIMVISSPLIIILCEALSSFFKKWLYITPQRDLIWQILTKLTQIFSSFYL